MLMASGPHTHQQECFGPLLSTLCMVRKDPQSKEHVMKLGGAFQDRDKAQDLNTDVLIQQ